MKSPPPPPPPPPLSPSTSSSHSSSLSPCNVLRVKKPRKPRSSKRSPKLDKSHSGNDSGKRSSVFRGVTRHRWTGRFEAHLWDKHSWNPIQKKKGRQVYLGAYEVEEAAARTYDLAALKYWGPETALNFPIETYAEQYQEMQGMSKEEYLASLRRRSSGFSRGVSKYRGVARHHQNGRWEARIGRVFGNKYLYLGTFSMLSPSTLSSPSSIMASSTQEEAAQAYDLAAIEYRGPRAVTNFDISRYINCHRTPLPRQPPSPPPLLPKPEPEAPREEEEEGRSKTEQMAADDSIAEVPWMTSCIDHGFDICYRHPFDFFDNAGFDDDIERLFEGS